MVARTPQKHPCLLLGTRGPARCRHGGLSVAGAVAGHRRGTQSLEPVWQGGAGTGFWHGRS